MNIKEILEFAESFREDLDRKILPDLPLYREGWRYRNLMQVIGELKEGHLTEVPDIAGYYPFCGDELPMRNLSGKAHELEDMLKELFAKQ